MERGSDKHGPMVDDELKKETRPIEQGEPSDPRVEDFKKKEELEQDEDEA